MSSHHLSPRLDQIATALRVGFGLVFIIGGWNKLAQLLDPARVDGILATYMDPHGYINAFFAEYLFTGRFGDWLTPWSFLTTLSAFELVSGLCILVGLLVRPLALLWGFLLWTFVMALPVVTAPGVVVNAETFTAPAMLVQIRDIGLSGFAFVIFNLGPGSVSFDRRLFGSWMVDSSANWDALGLLLRLSVAFPLIVGGAFAGLAGIQSFGSQALVLVPLGLALLLGIGVRVVAGAALAVLVWYVFGKLSLDATLIANLNAIKRELAFIAASLVIVLAGAGQKYALGQWIAERWNRPGLGVLRTR
jgi:uncharacterized membrane protein YphA (DoxX/SURF4 family)